MNRNYHLTIIFVILFGTLSLTCRGGTAVQMVGAYPTATHHGMSSTVYQAKFDFYAGKGYRLVHVDGYNVNGNVRFAAIWVKKPGDPWVAFHNMSSSTYQDKFDYYVYKKGYRLSHVDAYNAGGQAKFAAIWEKTSGPAWRARHNMSQAVLNSTVSSYAASGYRLYRLSGYHSGGTRKFAALWRKDTGSYRYKSHMTSSEYQDAYDSYVGSGYKPRYLNAYNDYDGSAKFAAVWKKMPGSYAARHNLTSANYQGVFNNYYYQGRRLQVVTGYQSGNKAKYAAFWLNTGLSYTDMQTIDSIIEKYMNDNDIPTLAFALTKDERLVFAKAWGYRDAQHTVLADPTNLFRIASMSKPITATAIMKIIEQDRTGNRTLETEIFSEHVFGDKYPVLNPPSSQITVKNLLEHHAGGWFKPPDEPKPMVQVPHYNHDQLISYVFNRSGLSRITDWELSPPDTEYIYSNFGYCLLGRVIEVWTGQPYEDWVKKNILEKAGIYNMKIQPSINCTAVGCDNPAPAKGVEYSQSYRRNIQRMDSHGGWLASPIDVVRFLVHVDGQPLKQDILSPATLNTMFSPSTTEGFYGKGWRIDGAFMGVKGYHGGSLSSIAKSGMGMQTKHANPADPLHGFSWAMAANKKAGAKMTDIIENILTSIDPAHWPKWDLF
jgi:CubicO group peptidase (beta-lactamase class C family)